MGIATLLTDFGLDDYYVAAVKGVILARAPGTTLVDVAHSVAPGDVAGATFLLAAAAPCFPPGTVHLTVVDPGVGSPRRMLAIETDAARFVAPDNGLLTPWLDTGRVFAVDRPDLYRQTPGQTFHGRDRFAPIAAAILAGIAPAELGPRIDDAVRAAALPPRRRGGVLEGRVVHVDRFGNAVTDLPASWLGENPFRAELAGHATSVRAGCYAELEDGRAGVIAGSLDTLELSLRDTSLAAVWGVRRGDPVRVVLDPGGGGSPTTARSGVSSLAGK